MADPAPGYYLDPLDPTLERWWDGSKWVGQTRRAKSGARLFPSEIVPPVGQVQVQPGYGQAAHLTEEQAFLQELAGVAFVSERVRSLRIRSYVFLVLAVLIGLIPAVMFANASAKGGGVWTGGALVALGLLVAAIRSSSAANRGAQMLAQAAGKSPQRHLPMFPFAVAAGVLLVAAVSWTVWSGQTSIHVGSCLSESIDGLSLEECSTPNAAWKVSGEVSDSSTCPATSKGSVNYVSAGQTYLCLIPNPDRQSG